MEYRLLGPLEVLDGSGHKLPLAGARQQSVLAALLLRAGQTVAVERLVDQLWEEPPATAARTVQVYVSRLRKELREGAIESRPGGYALLLNGDRLDLRAFEQAAEEGRAALASGDCERAAQLLREALALWRGPALAGLPSEALRREAERLEELRLQVLENRLEADLRRGRHREVVPELQALVAERPFRERLRAQLMLALYRSGRQGDALGLYRETRRVLVEELGMEPGQELRRLEQAILMDDPALQAAVGQEVAEGAAEQPTVPAGTITFLFTDIEGSTQLVKELRGRYGQVLDEHRRLLRAAFAAHDGYEIDAQGDSFFVAFVSAREALLAAVEGQLALLSHRWPDDLRLSVRIGLHTGQVVASGGRYTGLAVHRAARICAAGHGGQILVSQATQTLLEDEEEDLPFVLQDLGEERLKDFDRPVRLYQAAANGLPAEFPPLRIEASLAQAAEAAIPAPVWRRPAALALAALAVAAATLALVLLTTGGPGGLGGVRANHVGVIDPKTNTIVAEVPSGLGPGPIASSPDAIWVGNLTDRDLTRIDPKTRERGRTVSLDRRTPTGLAVSRGAVWVAHGLLGSISLVDPEYDERTVTIPVTNGSNAGSVASGSVALGGGWVWAVFGNSTLVGIDPNQVQEIDRGYAGNRPSGIVYAEGAVWVANSGEGRVYRFHPKTIANGPVALPISVGARPSAIAYDHKSIWVANAGDGTLTRINPLLNSTSTIRVGGHPSALAVSRGAVWVANSGEGAGAVSRIDPKTETVVKEIHTGNRPAGLAVGHGFVWVTVQSR
jgi:DNA-binding SARP family transcriptional activator/DNA-binding beta-propeller fold protein YncE